MLSRIETLFRRLRRNLSRSVWLARLLRLPVSEGSSTRPGLIMVQIDGLSHPQFERALNRGELPFLRRLLRREHYRMHDHYSGLPSTTPAVQAELFYGVKAAVPAFSFRDRESRRIVRMYEPDTAARVEALLASNGNEALLRDGSAYSDSYTGGAAESHFCPSSMGWGSTFRAANPLVLLAFLLSNFYSFLRVAVLVAMELGLALHDFVRGLIAGHDFFKELKFVPTRAAISILLRELCVIGGKIDISRGLPVIHINFLGYDEQSHRRGPRSLFAHWTLKGIDDAVARLWRAANHSAWRHYEVWVYSDHGQAAVQSYLQLQGYSLEDAVTAAFEKLGTTGLNIRSQNAGGIQTQRVRFLGGRKFQRLFSVLGINGGEADEQYPLVAALGPVGHVYFPHDLAGDARDFVARELAHMHKVPLVLSVTAPGTLCARTDAGEFLLPQDRAALFGAQHPFLDSVGEDLVRLCEHAEAGDLVLLGWRDGVAPMSFATENGAHAGASPEETHAFALLPADTPLAAREHEYLRPIDLRNAALQHLGRTENRPRGAGKRLPAAPTDSLRVMTYNVHGCVGMDGKLDVERIARVIARARPDVVALQELDVGRQRSLGMDQAHLIARYLEMEFHFHPAMHLEEERYGDAILTHLPQRLVKAGSLPGLAGKPHLEPRGALWVAADLHGREVQIINTHMGLYPRERIAQVATLLGSDWLAHEQCRGPVILCGDFNALPSSPVCCQIGAQLRDAQAEAKHHRPHATFSSRLPRMRIDHIFISPGLEVSGIEVSHSELARVASDHLPLIAEIRIPVHRPSAANRAGRSA
ncbi:MAG TPA: endonuclease/exonuclease/phosphatase family protein [Thiobacillus sp.]|jgi:endonuclease/exonuclease/phosphatase family metal-dependent hydrolase|nr:endonuclease/exonuclease/phosphatase family protein [Thiobacillus sp.]